jgi:hypothetical protein
VYVRVTIEETFEHSNVCKYYCQKLTLIGKRNSDTPKTITEATQQFPAFKQMDTTQQISNDPLDLSPSTTYSSEEYPISPSSPISSDYSNSYVPPVTMNELMLKPEVFMEVNEELEEGLEEGPSIIRITPTNRVKRLPDLHLPVSDYRKFKTFCEFVLKAERVL